MFKKDGSADDEPYWSLDINNGLLRFRGRTQEEQSFEVNSTSNVLGGWVHGAIYVQSDSIRLYVDGVLEGTIPRPYGDFPYKNYIWLGREGSSIFADASGEQYTGNIYDLRIWSAIPDPAYLTRWRWLPVPTSRKSGLARLYEFSVGEGDEVYDRSSNSGEDRNLLLQGDPLPDWDSDAPVSPPRNLTASGAALAVRLLGTRAMRAP